MITQPASFVAVPGTHVDGPGAFVAHEQRLISEGINENVPSKDGRFLRLATFNIHYFRDCNDVGNHDRVYSDIGALNPDVIVLQEVPDTLTSARYEPIDLKMASLGYAHVLRCNGEEFLELGNVIYSKLPLTATVSQKFSTKSRCFVSGVVEWAGTKLRVTGSHLDAYRESHRISEIAELASFHRDDDQKEGHVVMADFNAWYTSNVLQYMRCFGFVDSFDATGWERPAYTCWTGTAIDFILMCPVAREEWRVAGSYAYHTLTSDHLPIIIDLDPKRP